MVKNDCHIVVLLLMLLLQLDKMTADNELGIPKEALSLSLDRVLNWRELKNKPSAADENWTETLNRLATVLDAAEKKQELLHKNDARFLAINRAAFFRGLLVVWLPVSFVLPSLAGRRRTPANRNEGRSRDLDLGANLDSIDEGTRNKDHEFDPYYGALLSRLDGYFSLLDIEGMACRQRFLCEISGQEEQFQPLTQLFRTLFDESQKYPRPERYHKALKRFFQLYWAFQKGQNHGHHQYCHQQYPSCPWKMQQMLRFDRLLFWQKLAKKFAIQLQDE